MNCSGIYALYINNKLYVGSAVNIRRRTTTHARRLKLAIHPNKHLQSAYNKYQLLTISVLEYCDIDVLLKREELWIEWTKCYLPEFGYNKRRKPNSNLGLKASKETRAKHSARMMGHKFNKGRIPTKQQREKQSLLMKGRLKPHFRNIEKWPHLGGIKCKCDECKTKRNVKEKERLDRIRLINNVKPTRNKDKWPHEKGVKCDCSECKYKKSQISLQGWHRRKKLKLETSLKEQVFI